MKVIIERVDWSIPCKEVWSCLEEATTPADICDWIQNQITSMKEYDEPIKDWCVFINGNKIGTLTAFLENDSFFWINFYENQ